MKTSEIKELFDELEAEQLKRAGMARAEANNLTDLELARHIAENLADDHDGLCDADQVGRVLKDKYDIDTLGPAAGSLFRDAKWQFTGEWIKSVRKSNHCRMIRQWRLT